MGVACETAWLIAGGGSGKWEVDSGKWIVDRE
jgi:hypothetical protein